MNVFLWSVFAFCILFFVYHHFLYPVIVRFFADHQGSSDSYNEVNEADYPRIAILLSAYNEQAFIRNKMMNLGALNYPREKLEIHIGLDGCTDNTEQILNQAIVDLTKEGICCVKHNYSHNRGKIAVVNDLISSEKHKHHILVFTDVSALSSLDCLKRVVVAFSDQEVGVLSGDYLLFDGDIAEQNNYWNYQNTLRKAEGNLGAVIGVPGAMYAIRSELVELIPKRTINDDFVLPMLAMEKGCKAIVDPDINIVEMDKDTDKAEKQRRIRIGAGNLQQVFMLKRMLSPKFGWLAFNFASGKALRGIMPLILLLGAYCLAHLSISGDMVAITMMFGTLLLVLLPECFEAISARKGASMLKSLRYLLFSYGYSLFGIMNWVLGKYRTSWKRGNIKNVNAVPKGIRMTKRVIDIVGATLGLILLSPVMFCVALAIRCESPGSILYRQVRVGKVEDSVTHLFYVIKFRSMSNDAEKNSGAVWATKHDPRVTRVGRFLRKSRLDELPQLWNVVKGDMALIGPRPERPAFYTQLNSAIPMYYERTHGVKPGISGLAQVMNGYDENIEGVKSKLAWDFSYSLSMMSWNNWLNMEYRILTRTLLIVLLCKGQ